MSIPSRFTFWRKDITGTATVAYLHSDVVARCTADNVSAALVRRWFFSKPGDFIEISIWARIADPGAVTKTGGQLRLDYISGASHTTLKSINLTSWSWRKYTISFQRNMLGDSYGNVLSFGAGFNTGKDGLIDLREPELRINGKLAFEPSIVMQGTVVFNSSGDAAIESRAPNEYLAGAGSDAPGGRAIVTPIEPIRFRAVASTDDPVRDVVPEIMFTVSRKYPAAVEALLTVSATINMDTGGLSFWFYNAAGALVTNKALWREYVITFRVSA